MYRSLVTEHSSACYMRITTLLWALCVYHVLPTTSLATDNRQIVLGATALHSDAATKQPKQRETAEATAKTTMATPPAVGAGAIDFDAPGDDEYTRYEENLEHLLLYRVWYHDDEAWANFLRVLTRANFAAPDSDGYSDGEDMDLDYDLSELPFTIMDDRAAYEGASKDAVRNAFRAWVAARSPARDGKGVAVLDGPHGEFRVKNTPRYRFCLYVDRDVMLAARSTYRAHKLVSGRERRYFSTGGYAVLIDAAFDDAYYDNPNRPAPEPDVSELEEIESGDYTYEEWLEVVTDGDDGYAPVEGRVSRDVGWCFVRLPTRGLYESLLANTLEWDRYYRRPPLVYPDGKPLSEA